MGYFESFAEQGFQNNLPSHVLKKNRVMGRMGISSLLFVSQHEVTPEQCPPTGTLAGGHYSRKTCNQNP